MSLNIFIDVDGTLLNTNDGIDPRAEEILRQIRRKMNTEYPDSGLYLWSGAGGDYARSKAEEHGLAGFFSGFAGKPDVIIDDNPSSVFPRKTVLWRGDDQWQYLMPTMFTKFSPSDKLIDLVEKIRTKVRETDCNYSDLYGGDELRYPIPFFGDLENAEVLIFGVNPSAKEFKDRSSDDRDWPQTMRTEQLSSRLVNYFRLWNPPPHAWFTPLETKLRRTSSSYLFNAVHIDLSPRATRAMRTFSEKPAKFHQMIREDAVKFIPELLGLAKKVKHVRFPRGYGVIPNGNKAWPDLKVYVQKELPEVWLCLDKYQISLL